MVGFAGLAGTPITGALIDNYNSYTGGIAFSAAAMMVGAILMTVARYYYGRGKLIA